MAWQNAGEILISAAGAAHVPKLFDEKLELIKQAGAELTTGCISLQTTKSIAEQVMPIDDYRAMCTASFSGLLGSAKAAGIAMRAMAWKYSPSHDENGEPNN